MRLYRISILLLCFLILTCFGWERTYGGPGDQKGLSIAKTSSGNWIISGSYVDESDTVRVNLFKITPTGSVIWSSELNLKGITDEIYQPVPGKFGIMLENDIYTLIDSNETIFASVIFYYEVQHFLITPDRGFCVSGYSIVYEPHETMRYFQFAKFNANGSLLSGNTVFIYGYMNIFSSSCNLLDDYVLKVSNSDYSFIIREYGPTLIGDLILMLFHDCCRVLPDEFVLPAYDSVANNIYVAGYWNNDFTLWAFTRYGDSLWIKIFPENYSTVVEGIIGVNNGGVVYGSYKTDSLSDENAFIFKFDEFGDSVWFHSYGSSLDDRFMDIELTGDSGFILVGYKGSTTDSQHDLWVVSLDSSGYSAISDSPTEKPSTISLFAYPNPFNSSVTIFTPIIADLEIYDFLGNLVHSAATTKAGKALFDIFPDSHNPGRYIWQPDENFGSGVYLVRARVDGQTTTKRVVYLK